MSLVDNKKEQERAELHRTIWSIANDLRGSVDGWDFKQYVLGMLCYRYISENIASYIFDATTLNTLWVDKNLKQHGLLQAYSRTNRILNTVKTFGNIVCFRDLKQATDDAISLFGDKNAGGIVVLNQLSQGLMFLRHLSVADAP